MQDLQNYDWKNHYVPDMKAESENAPFQRYRISNETGTGEVIYCIVFPGVQAVFNDLFLLH